MQPIDQKVVHIKWLATCPVCKGAITENHLRTIVNNVYYHLKCYEELENGSV